MLFLVELDHVKSGTLSTPEMGRVTSLPIWPLAETRVTPLIALDERREHLKEMLERLATVPA